MQAPLGQCGLWSHRDRLTPRPRDRARRHDLGVQLPQFVEIRITQARIGNRVVHPHGDGAAGVPWIDQNRVCAVVQRQHRQRRNIPKALIPHRYDRVADLLGGDPEKPPDGVNPRREVGMITLHDRAGGAQGGDIEITSQPRDVPNGRVLAQVI
ncbi:Uncharacterised protein [Mycobacteroides abscessus subsp. abscessus]|nr:Uncharacterised protein [Mycobacteroides abscessus subsp. abscessus]